MDKKKKTTSPSQSKRIRPLSLNDLGKFLKQLSYIYKDPRTGNTALSDALFRLSIALSSTDVNSLEGAVHQLRLSFEAQVPIELGQLKELKAPEIKRLLDGDEISKSDLTRLGNVRFGIPRSRMMRISRSEVIGLIQSALQHEQSLEIIAEEARRGGADRASGESGK